jgi:hypothetical protein
MTMTKNRLLGLSLLACSLVAPGSSARGDDDGERFQARLVAFQEVPALSSPGRGTFKASLSDDGSTVSYELTYSGLEGTASVSHIHFGQRSVNGGVSVFLCGGTKPACPASGTVTGEFTAADVTGPAGQGIAAGEFAELLRAMRSGNTYANVHSSKFPGGEIRGQIKAHDEDHD